MTDDTETDTPDVLAAEYVLGTLASNEREQAQAMIENDPAFAQLVRAWEQRLGQLQAMVGPVEPPPETWARIQARLDGTDPSAVMLLPHPDDAARVAAESNVVRLRRRVGRWRQATAGLAAIAAALIAFVVTSVLDPDLLPGALRPKPVEIVRTVEKPVEKIVERPVNPGRFVAVLQQDAASPAFILTVDVAARTASVRRVAAAPQAGKSYQLWLVSDRFPKPRSLGLVGTEQFSRPPLASYDPATISGATYAVSLEPEGGAPDPDNGPSGPVLFTAKLVETVPPAP
ncbi:MAG TPA: anti-sigma factor [Xanthobacteraceae bacterium]|jgi:anti-sigma-K factor RskA